MQANVWSDSCPADDEDLAGQKKAKHLLGLKAPPSDNDCVFDKDWAFQRKCTLGSLLYSRLSAAAVCENPNCENKGAVDMNEAAKTSGACAGCMPRKRRTQIKSKSKKPSSKEEKPSKWSGMKSRTDYHTRQTGPSRRNNSRVQQAAQRKEYESRILKQLTDREESSSLRSADIWVYQMSHLRQARQPTIAPVVWCAGLIGSPIHTIYCMPSIFAITQMIPISQFLKWESSRKSRMSISHRQLVNNARSFVNSLECHSGRMVDRETLSMLCPVESPTCVNTAVDWVYSKSKLLRWSWSCQTQRRFMYLTTDHIFFGRQGNPSVHTGFPVIYFWRLNTWFVKMFVYFQNTAKAV